MVIVCEFLVPAHAWRDIASASRYVPIRDNATNPIHEAWALSADRDRTDSHNPSAAANARYASAATARSGIATTGVPLIGATTRRPATASRNHRPAQAAPINL